MNVQAGIAHPRRPRLTVVRRGDYFSSERELYLVEGVQGSHALVEECRTGRLLDMPLTELAELERVRA